MMEPQWQTQYQFGWGGKRFVPSKDLSAIREKNPGLFAAICERLGVDAGEQERRNMCDYEYPEAVVADNPGIHGRRWWEPEQRAEEDGQPEKGKAESVEVVRHDGE